MPKSKNNRKAKKNNNNHLKSAPSKSSIIVNHSPNSTLLATLINNNDLNGLSFFIQELCHESKLTFDHNSKEWFEIFIESIKNDKSLTLYVAKSIYYHYSSDIYNDNIFFATKLLAEYVWTNSSNAYKDECILPVSIKRNGYFIDDISPEEQCVIDTASKLLEWTAVTETHYQSTLLKSVINRQNVQRKIANF